MVPQSFLNAENFRNDLGNVRIATAMASGFCRTAGAAAGASRVQPKPGAGGVPSESEADGVPPGSEARRVPPESEARGDLIEPGRGDRPEPGVGRRRGLHGYMLWSAVIYARKLPGLGNRDDASWSLSVHANRRLGLATPTGQRSRRG